MIKTAIITSDTSIDHDTGPGHPEKPDRVTAVLDGLKNENLIWKNSKKFDEEIIKLLTQKICRPSLKFISKKGLFFLDGDTIVSPGSKRATYDAVGSIVTAIDGIEKKKFDNAFCGVRLPGHHNCKEKAMGFCIFNNVAVGANYLINKYNYKKNCYN